MSVGQIEEIESMIQAKVGEFLQGKQKLLEMQTGNILTIQSEAKDLYASQLELENQLSSITDLIKKIKEDSYSMSDIIVAGQFYYNMSGHVDNVNNLYLQYRGLGGQPGLFAGLPSWAWLVIGGGAIWFFLKRGRK